MYCLEDLPSDLLNLIVALVPRRALPGLLLVSSAIRNTAVMRLALLEEFCFVDNGKVCTRQEIMAVVLHCKMLKTINGIVVAGNSKRAKEGSVSVSCLWRMLHNNPCLEHLVLYDHHVTDSIYLSSFLVDVASSFPSLKMFYSEACHVEEAIAKFLETNSSLEEVAFPNASSQALTVKMWSGPAPSSFKLCHTSTSQAIVVWHKPGTRNLSALPLPRAHRPNHVNLAPSLVQPSGRHSLAQSIRPKYQANEFVKISDSQRTLRTFPGSRSEITSSQCSPITLSAGDKGNVGVAKA